MSVSNNDAAQRLPMSHRQSRGEPHTHAQSAFGHISLIVWHGIRPVRVPLSTHERIAAEAFKSVNA